MTLVLIMIIFVFKSSKCSRFAYFSGAKGRGNSMRLSGAILKEVKLNRSRNLQLSAIEERSESRTSVSVVQSISSELTLPPHADRNSLRPTRVG